ncbi:hypothetical protein ADK65_12595 [Streptomyces sp. NRRL B-1140]|nr:hypothetical protein ADK65_12595 [Streptomyces sp. NRRL B-1140]
MVSVQLPQVDSFTTVVHFDIEGQNLIAPDFEHVGDFNAVGAFHISSKFLWVNFHIFAAY